MIQTHAAPDAGMMTSNAEGKAPTNVIIAACADTIAHAYSTAAAPTNTTPGHKNQQTRAVPAKLRIDKAMPRTYGGCRLRT
ncbi:hypothetical protein CS8_042010 [Cupriavidus sp. 8B]